MLQVKGSKEIGKEEGVRTIFSQAAGRINEEKNAEPGQFLRLMLFSVN
jgi:hypothetical protein